MGNNLDYIAPTHLCDNNRSHLESLFDLKSPIVINPSSHSCVKYIHMFENIFIDSWLSIHVAAIRRHSGLHMQRSNSCIHVAASAIWIIHGVLWWQKCHRSAPPLTNTISQLSPPPLCAGPYCMRGHSRWLQQIFLRFILTFFRKDHPWVLSFDWLTVHSHGVLCWPARYNFTPFSHFN